MNAAAVIAKTSEHERIRDVVRARVQARARAMAGALMLVFNRWAGIVAREESAKYLGRYPGPRVELVRKTDEDDARFEAELLRIVQAYGLRQWEDAGRDAAAYAGGAWYAEPSAVRDFLAGKEIKIQQISETTREAVLEQVRTILQEARAETPQPSAGEVARRIRSTFYGTEDGPPAMFSSERAATIARTELVQSENSGIVHGYTVSGVDEIEWLSYARASQFDRRHDLLNHKRVKLGEFFLTPLGHRLLYPGDPAAPIKETANCECTIAPVRRSRYSGAHDV